MTLQPISNLNVVDLREMTTFKEAMTKAFDMKMRTNYYVGMVVSPTMHSMQCK
jgi:hypothetical protein